MVEFLVGPDTSKTIIGVELTKDQVKALSEDEEKYYKMCKAFIDPYVTNCDEILMKYKGMRLNIHISKAIASLQVHVRGTP